MAGYSRQSVADIIANAVIKAAPVNAEYNAIRDAFAFSGGHKHDGSSTEGAYVPLIADTDALNKVVVDTANNRISFYSEVGAAAVEQLRIQDGAIVPVTDNDIDLGSSGLKFKNLYVDGIGEIGSVTILGGTIDNAVIGGTTPAAGTFTSVTATTADINGGTIDGAVIGNTSAAAGTFTNVTATGTSTLATVDINGGAIDGTTIGATSASTGAFTNVTASGTLAVTGTSTLTGTATITSADINSGAIDNTVIGNTTPVAGSFTTLSTTGLATLASADVNGGNIDGTIIGASTPAAATVTNLTASGTSTLTTVDINGGTIDGTTIGASGAAAGSFTTVSTSGQATLATVDINGGAIDGTTIGATTPAAITGTTVTATSFVGPVTGNITGNVTGNVTGDLTGDVTGNVTASSGSSTFNNVTINGTLNMDAATTATITNLTTPTNTNDAATKGYVDTSVANLVDSAPGTLDTLNELAAALGDDPNFSTTITNSIATKLPLAGGTMTGAIAMGTNKITGLGDPTAAQDAATQNYVTTNFLDLSGGTMTGAIDMGSSKVTTTYAPVNGADLTNKTYVDAILGSTTDAATSAAAAATSATNAATSETNAANSATAAASSATSAAASYDDFDDRYLGAKASAPALDNDGDALVVGALYFNTTTDIMYVYGSSGWQAAGSSVNGTAERNTYTATSGQTTFSATYDPGYVDVYLNGVKLISGTDFTATSGTSIVLTTGATAGDSVDIVAYGTFVVADTYTKSQSDARYLLESNNLSDLDSAATARTNLGLGTGDSPSFAGLTVDTNTLYVDSTNNRVGIGTTSPDTQLVIANSTDTLKSNLDSDSIDIFASGKTFNLGTTSNNVFRFFENNSEAMRITGGNVLVGTTDTVGGVTGTTPGVAIRADGGVFFTRANADGLNVNRTSSDGAIAQFRKDGTVVGSIGTDNAGDLFIGTGDTGLLFVDSADAIMPWNTSPAARTEAISLGDASNKFKDLYLSGTVNAGSFVGDGSGLTGVGFTTNVITGNTTATANNHYYLNGSAITLTLPASPSVGDEVRISEVAGNTDCVIGRNGSNIMGDASDLTIDTAYLVLSLRYVDATIGWAFS